MNFLSPLVSVLLLAGGTAMAGTYEEGIAALGRGDYTNAFNLLRPLAMQGDAESQFQLSLMYSSGRGVMMDTRESIKWLRSAAKRGSASAQSNLASAYSRGRGVPEDAVRAYTWSSIAAASGSKEAAVNREVVKRRMTTGQIEQAQKLIQACLQDNFRSCD